MSNIMFDELFQASIKKPQQQDQKYHSMLVSGLSTLNGELDVLSARPINQTNLKQFYFKKKIEVVDQVHYHYLPFINRKIVRNIFVWFSTIIYLKWYILKHGRRNVTIICDTLNLSLSSAVINVCKLFRVKTVAVVTDIPLLLEQDGTYYKKKAMHYIKKYDKYVYLTEEMNQLCNPKNHPYCIIEGMIIPTNTITQKSESDLFNLMYAGGLYKSNGIELLLHTFAKLDPSIFRLHLYGNGDCNDLVKDYASKYESIQYHGVVKNEVIMEQEQHVSLLVTLRDPKETFTKYSFPSKLMEYCSSGTPVLTTWLEGIPKEYEEYLIILEEYSEEALYQKILELSTMDHQEMQKLGLKARQFVEREKSHITQANKLLELINH